MPVCRRLPGDAEGTCVGSTHPTRPTSLPHHRILMAVGLEVRGCGRGGGFLKALFWAAVINFLVNALLLAGTAQMAMQRLPVSRWLSAALLGALYAAGCLRLSFLGALHWRLVCLVLMSAIAFGRELRQGCIFIVLTLALEGTALAYGRGSWWQLPFFSALVFLMGKFAFGRAKKRLLPAEIQGNGKSLKLTALLDTGNELRDPITMEPVLVIDSDSARALTGLTREQLGQPLETMTHCKLPGLRLIPYHAVGKEKGLLLAMRMPQVRIGGRKGALIVAMAPQRFGEDFQAIAGGML